MFYVSERLDGPSVGRTIDWMDGHSLVCCFLSCFSSCLHRLVSIATELCSGVYKSIEDLKAEWKLRLQRGTAAEAARQGGLAAEADEKETSDSD